MQKDTDNTNPSPETTTPKTRVISSERRRHDDLPEGMQMPPDIAALALPHFMKLAPDTMPETVNRILRHIQDGIQSELDGHPEPMNRMLAENAALFDLAARYYFSGGETGQAGGDNFKMSMKACHLSMEALINLRKNRWQEKHTVMRQELHDFEIGNKKLMQSELIQKAMAVVKHGSAYQGYFDKKTQKMAERSRSHD